MRIAYAAVLMLPLLLGAGCARAKPETPASQPEAAATEPRTPPAAVTPPAKATPRSAPAPAPAPTPTPTPTQTPAPAPAPAPAPRPAPAPTATAPAPPAAAKSAPSVAKAPAAAPTLDLTALKERLKDTKAIGIFTKITLKNQVDDLLDQFRAFHQGKAKLTITDLRRSYELMMMKVLSLLQDEDQALASDIVSSREAIWGLLADPKKFAALQG